MPELPKLVKEDRCHPGMEFLLVWKPPDDRPKAGLLGEPVTQNKFTTASATSCTQKTHRTSGIAHGVVFT